MLDGSEWKPTTSNTNGSDDGSNSICNKRPSNGKPRELGLTPKDQRLTGKAPSDLK